MPLERPTLHMVYGNIAAGKSTLTAQLGQADNTVVIAEDTWLSALFGDQMHSVQDYVRCSTKLRTVMGSHVKDLLQASISVVLDFPANTPDARAWMRSIFEDAEADHVLHVLDVPDEVCLDRLRARNAQGTHPFSVTEAQFRQISKHITRPAVEEAFTIQLHQNRPI
ncbi:MAG: ATP-binding protein [Pseudomonadota bacterium]